MASRIATSLLHRAAQRLPLRLVYPDGSVIGAADPSLPTLVLADPERLARRIGHSGLIGFGESYMAGEWTSADLVGVLTAFATSMADLVPRSLQRMRPIALARQPESQRNSRDQARRSISEHSPPLPTQSSPVPSTRRLPTPVQRVVRHSARDTGPARRRPAAQDRYADPGRLVLVWESAPFFGLRDSPVSPANYVDWKARQGV